MTVGVAHETNCGASNIAAQVAARRAGKRKYVRHGGTLCCRCLENPPISKTDRMCKICRALDRKERRKAERLELKRLRALEQQQLKGKDHEEIGSGSGAG